MSAPLTAMDFVRMHLARHDWLPLNGHHPESTACRVARPSGAEKDCEYRCARCDGEVLLAREEER